MAGALRDPRPGRCGTGHQAERSARAGSAVGLERGRLDPVKRKAVPRLPHRPGRAHSTNQTTFHTAEGPPGPSKRGQPGRYNARLPHRLRVRRRYVGFRRPPRATGCLDPPLLRPVPRPEVLPSGRADGTQRDPSRVACRGVAAHSPPPVPRVAARSRATVVGRLGRTVAGRARADPEPLDRTAWHFGPRTVRIARPRESPADR